MYNYITAQQAIIGLHERGFNEDFQIYGNDLLWLREKVFIRAGEFSIAECHSFCRAGKNQPERIIFGIDLLSENVRGILIKRVDHSVNKVPPVIHKKLSELMEQTKPGHSDQERMKARTWVGLSSQLQVVMRIKNLRFWSDELIWSHSN